MDDTKLLLADGELEMNSMIETKETQSAIFTWTIMKYSELAEEVLHYRKEHFHENKLIFTLRKNKHWLFLTFKSENVLHFESFSIIGKNDQVLNYEIFVTEERYVCTEIRNEVMLDPNNGFLNDDILIVQCKCLYKQNDANIRVIPWDEHRERGDLVHFQNEWREMYLQSRFWDFKIFVEDNVFYTHKVILGARSEYFAYRFSRDGSHEDDIGWVNAPSKVFHEVLMFMYTGELVEMSCNSMLDVFELTLLLGITTLLEKCVSIFRDLLDSNNVIHVCAKAEALQYWPLVFDCFEFMDNVCRDQRTKYDELKSKGLEHLAMMGIEKLNRGDTSL